MYISCKKTYQNHHHLILTTDLESVFKNYSNDRLTDTSTEYKSELPMIQELLLKMKPSQKELLASPCLFTREQLIKKLSNILSMSHFTFKDGKEVTPQSLAAFLYKINFITARKSTGSETYEYITMRISTFITISLILVILMRFILPIVGLSSPVHLLLFPTD